MKSFEGIGKTIEKAIENALFELKAKREDVDIKIIDEGGIFKKAKVLVSISQDCIEDYENKTTLKADDVEEKLAVKAIFADVETLTKEEKKKEKETVKEEKKQNKEEKKQEGEKKKLQKVSGAEFVKNLLEMVAKDFRVYSEEKDGCVFVKVEGGNSGDLIGYRGECLNAIQYIASVVENENSETKKKFILDIENYRAKREETLKALAHRMENRVAKTGRAIKLEPMAANERRIIHTELQTSQTVTTTSKGTEPSRYVVIVPNKKAEENETEE